MKFKTNNLSEKEVFYIIIILAVSSGVISAILGMDGAWWKSLLQNFCTEMIGALVTYWLFTKILGRQEKADEKAEAEQVEKRRLIVELGSNDNAIATNAFRQIASRDWHKDGTLKGVNLTGADLHNTHMMEANLEGAILINTNLQGANLEKANLQNTNFLNAKIEEANLSEANLQNSHLFAATLRGANLYNANLKEGHLYGANLEGASLAKANLEDADLRESILIGTDLHSANLKGADLSAPQRAGALIFGLPFESVKYDETTVLPNAEYLGNDNGDNPIYDKYWTPETDMGLYTDPNHKNKDGNSDFWQPDWVQGD